MHPASDIEQAQLANFLSIRIATIAKQSCFFFSFRIHGTEAQFVQAAATKVVATARRGENLTFDPSNIPPEQGQLLFIGDILLKDAAVTHCGRYLDYLRSEVLPSDTPIFDSKRRFKDAIGNHTSILTVRCGKAVSTKVAESLSTALDGSSHTEIFISRLALGANQTTKTEHEEIYRAHQDFLDDLVYLPFTVTNHLDTPVTEFLDSAERI